MSLNTLEFLCGQAAAAIKRNPLVSIAAVTNVAVALAILSAFALAAMNLQHLADLEAQSAVITCELSEDAEAADVEAALLGDLRVKRTQYVGKDEALEVLGKKYGHNMDYFNKVIGNPLPNTIHVYIANPDEIAAVCEAASKIKGVTDARYPEQVTEKILVVARGVKISGAVVGLILIMATLTVISTTIRLTIYARRREIRIMQLVGATRWFIRLPFLLEGVFHGFIGGLVAAVGVLMGYIYIDSYVSTNLEFMNLMSSSRFLTLFALCTVLAGVLFGAIGSMTGVRRYLQAV